jgi:hypothetical protein
MEVYMRLKKELIFMAIAILITFSLGSSMGMSASCKKCEDLLTTHFGPGVKITSAKIRNELDPPGGKGNPIPVSEYCEVRGTELPENNFVIKLPTEWNGNYFQTGNGGLAGSILENNINFGLKLGYTAAGANGGHDGAITDATFCYNPPNNSNPRANEKLDDYCFGSIHKTNVLAKKIIGAYYCKGPTYSYYQGCSTGGRQGLIEAQRYPEDFDGLMIGAPLVYLTKITMRDIWQAQRMVEGEGLTNEKMKMVADAVMKKCDETDGLKDGLIDDPRKCAFDALSELPACPGDVDAANCFTAAQRTTIKRIYDGPRNSAGDLLFKGAPLGSEAIGAGPFGPASGWHGWIIPFPKAPMSIGAMMGSSFVQYCTLPPQGGGPNWNLKSFNWDTDWPNALSKMSSKCDAYEPNLLPLKLRGGKVIQYHGFADPLVSPFASIEYYESVLNYIGDKATKEFYKLYMIPGLFHCSGGVGCSDDNAMFGALVKWVEKGVEPKSITGSRIADGKVVRTRPMCPYPSVARYTGTGSIDDAKNYTCE